MKDFVIFDLNIEFLVKIVNIDQISSKTLHVAPNKWYSRYLFDFSEQLVSKQIGFPEVFEGPGRFKKVREAC